MKPSSSGPAPDAGSSSSRPSPSRSSVPRRSPFALWRPGLFLALPVAAAVFFLFLSCASLPWPVCLLPALAAGILLPLRLRLGARAGRWLSRGVLLLFPAVGFVLVEVQNYNDPLAAFSPLYLFLNLGFYYILALVLYLLLGRPRAAGCVSLALFWFIGLANRYVLDFRGRAIFPGDLLSLGTALNVAGRYNYTLRPAQLYTGLACLLLVLLAMTLPRQEKRSPLRLRSALPSAGACLAFLAVFFFSPFLNKMDIRPDLWTTRGDGFVLHFALCLKSSVVPKPEGYSLGALSDLRRDLPDAPAGGGTQPVNVIVVMNEAFSDLSVLGALETNRDPMPFLRSLTENTVKGTAYVSVFGGSTANSEYEFLTGNTTAFFPPGAIPYQMYVKPGSASLVEQMNTLGYRSVAAHPYWSSGWNRRAVYPYLGFSRSLFLSDFQNTDKIRDYVSDQADYRELIRLYEEKEPGEKLFLFNVTMQNHSSYTLPWTGLPREVYLTGAASGRYPAVDQYLSLVYQSDLALQELVSYFAQVEEPTMLLLFGDHQPHLYDEFYTTLLGSDPDAQDIQKKQAVPFLIWANYDIDERTDLRLSLNYLSALLMDAANLPLTDYQRFLLTASEDLPVVNAIGYLDGEGTWTDREQDLSPAARETLRSYRMLQYNDVFEGERNRQGDWFSLSPSA